MSVSMNWSVSFSQEKNIYEGLLDLDFLYYFYIPNSNQFTNVSTRYNTIPHYVIVH